MYIHYLKLHFLCCSHGNTTPMNRTSAGWGGLVCPGPFLGTGWRNVTDSKSVQTGYAATVMPIKLSKSGCWICLHKSLATSTSFGPRLVGFIHIKYNIDFKLYFHALAFQKCTTGACFELPDKVPKRLPGSFINWIGHWSRVGRVP